MTDFGFIFLGFIIGFLLTNVFVVFYTFKKKSKLEFVEKKTGDVYRCLGKTRLWSNKELCVVLESTKDTHIQVEPLEKINNGTSEFKRTFTK